MFWFKGTSSRIRKAPASLGALLLLAISLPVTAAAARPGIMAESQCEGPYLGPMPLAVLFVHTFVQYDWGSHIPRFVLYEDGHVIFARCDAWKTCSYYDAMLSPAELDHWMAELAATQAFRLLQPMYEPVDISDLNIYELFLPVGGRLRSVRVYALNHPGARPCGGDASSKDCVPSEFVRYYELITAFDAPQAKPWLPDWLSVYLEDAGDYLSPEELAKRSAVRWPGRLPHNIEDAGWSPHILVPAKHWSLVDRMEKAERQAPKFGIEIAGARWLISEARPVFPSACLWESRALAPREAHLECPDATELEDLSSKPTERLLGCLQFGCNHEEGFHSLPEGTLPALEAELVKRSPTTRLAQMMQAAEGLCLDVAAEVLTQINEPDVDETMKEFADGSRSRRAYLALRYFARRGEKWALQSLNDSYLEFPVSSAEWAETVELFGEYRYLPAARNLSRSVNAPNMNMGWAAHQALCKMFPEAAASAQQLPGPTAAEEFWVAYVSSKEN